MKRRDFLSAAASGVTGALLTRAAGAAEVPCPPPSISVKGGATVGTTCVSPPPPIAGAAPAWFVNTPDGTWTSIAGSQGQRIVDVLPSPVPNSGLSGEDPQSLVTAWSGASVEQARGEYMFIAGGGHADYPGNEGYALTLRAASPAWRRISDPTPNALLTSLTATNGVLSYSDGRPRADHTSGWPTWADGRVWFPAQSAATSGAGSASAGVYSYNRDALGNALTSMLYGLVGSGVVNPWTMHGTIPGMENASANGSFTFGCAVFDRVNHYVYGLSGFGYDRTTFYYWRVKTSGSNIGVVDHCFIANGGNPFANATWAACAYDLGIIVMGDGSVNQRIIVLDLTKVGQSGDWTPITNVSGSGYFGPNMKGCGANYIVANNTIGIGDPFAIGGKIYRLQIPTKLVNGAKVYNPAGQWAWTSITPGGMQPAPSPRDVGTFTKFNLIEDMGNGQSAFVYCGDINGPTYVYKIPIAGL